MDTIQKSLVISGRVQGVGFRHFTRINARDLGVTGWVKNRRDGNVEALLQGTPKDVSEMIDRLKKGPSAARVENIEMKVLPVTGEHSVFEVRS